MTDENPSYEEYERAWAEFLSVHDDSAPRPTRRSDGQAVWELWAMKRIRTLEAEVPSTDGQPAKRV